MDLLMASGIALLVACATVALHSALRRLAPQILSAGAHA